jgi:hypothetical protein
LSFVAASPVSPLEPAPLEAPLGLALPDRDPATLDPDAPPESEAAPEAAPALVVPAADPDPLVERPLPTAPVVLPAPAALDPLSLVPGPCWLAMQAAVTKHPQTSALGANMRPMAMSVEAQRPFDRTPCAVRILQCDGP